VQSFAKSFFGKLGADIEEMKRGTIAGTYQGPFRKDMEKRVEVDFAWKLLSGDLIEEKGKITRSEAHAGNGSLDPLARRLAAVLSLPLPFVETKIRKLADRNHILCREEDGWFRWEWKE